MILNRGDFGEPRTNFTRTWLDYKHGFGSLNGEFWFGNDFIHRLTYEATVTLRIELEDFENNFAFAEYSHFRLDESGTGCGLFFGIIIILSRTVSSSLIQNRERGG